MLDTVKRVPPEEPAERKGADDPFQEVDPEDPFGFRPSTDPYVPSNPEPESTTNRGIAMPPPAPPVAPAEPAGRVNLRAGLKRFTDRQATLGNTEPPNLVARAERTVQPGRNELGVHWAVTFDVFVANERARIEVSDEGDKTGIDKLASTLSNHPEFGEALSAWCRARDAVPPDEATLSIALTQATDSLNRLKANLEDRGFNPNSLNDPLAMKVQAIRVFAEACLKCLADEAATMMTGERVPRGAPSEGMGAVLAMGTGDQNFQTRLATTESWADAGKTLRNVIGTNTLKDAVTRTTGPLDFTRVHQELASLDASLKARKTAADPIDPAMQTTVYNDYLAVIDAHVEQLQKLRAAAKEGPGGKSGWSAAKLREVPDLLVGVLRTVKNELSADPLVQDPKFAARTREMVEKIDALAGQTSLEVDSNALGSDLRKVWKSAKSSELATLKKAGVDTKKLSAAFDAGLGPTLESWTTELAKFPKHNRETMKQLTAQAATYIASYRTTVTAIAGPLRSSNLVRALDTVAVAMRLQLRAYDARGGLF